MTVPAPGRPLRDRGDTSDGCCEVVITAADGMWLDEFAQRLVDERLAACVHSHVGIRAIYRWDGAVHDDPQFRAAVHTRASLVPAIVALADAEHPDDVPCVIALPLVGGHPAYLRWIVDETIDPDTNDTRARASSSR
ncbi:MAG: divalent-cation tolerance protein CutA [Ilumatobacteraceae bacterium]